MYVCNFCLHKIEKSMFDTFKLMLIHLSKFCLRNYIVRTRKGLFKYSSETEVELYQFKCQYFSKTEQLTDETVGFVRRIVTVAYTVTRDILPPLTDQALTIETHVTGTTCDGESRDFIK